MKVVIAPDSFKESLSAAQAAAAIEAGMAKVHADWTYVQVPMADGGEGTLKSILDACQGELHTVTVKGPLGDPVRARFGVIEHGGVKTAVIEMAEASGLTKVPAEDRDVMQASTYGTGQLMLEALEQGCKRLVVCLGGSATVDGGMGAAEALGVAFLDADGRGLHGCGASLAKLASIDTSAVLASLESAEIYLACDVDNPLVGENGAAHIFAPQKGASKDQVNALEVGMKRYGELLEAKTGKKVLHEPGAGAAGGLAAGLAALFGAKFSSGVDLVAGEVGLMEKLAGADLVVTGEGEINGQTSRGKTPVGVARLAKKHDLPVVALAGALGKGHELVYDCGIDAVESIVPYPCTRDHAIDHAAALLEGAAERLARKLTLLTMGQKV